MAKYEPQLSKEVDYHSVAEAIIRMAAVYRSPFISIIGYSEALLEGLSGELSAAQKEDIKAIQGAGWQAIGQLNDILDVMGLLTDEMEHLLGHLNMNHLLKDVVRDVNRTYTDNMPKFHAEIAEDLPTVEADELRLRQMLLGLIASGMQSSPPGAEVCLSAKGTDEGIEIRILDGCEVANVDDLSYFFEPSWLSRLQDNRWRRMQWQSYLAYRFVMAYKGRIWVEHVPSAGDKKAGTQVTIMLPKVAENPTL